MSPALEVAVAKKTTSVRIGDDALKLARIASGYTDESVVDYITRVIAERAQVDIDKGHAALHKPKGRGESKN